MTSRAVTVVIVLIALAAPLGGASDSGTRAFATFIVDHGNECTVTTAAVEVVEDAEVVFHYDVFGQPTSPGCDGLWYNFIDGTAALAPGEFEVEANRKSARLQKMMEVRDDESGTTFNVLLDVSWTTVNGGGPPSTQASLSVTAPQIEFDPLTQSDTAGIVRLRHASR
jgi:hypothetical protein